MHHREAEGHMAEVWSGWDQVSDVVVVGSGAAGLAAAVAAAEAGATVTVLEREARFGGTTAKSSGGMWIPANPLMKEQGLEDPREQALEYMCRIAYPALYDAGSPTCGVPQSDHDLIAAFYDHGAEAIEALERAGALHLNRERGNPYPDYHADLPQDAAPWGRAISPRMPPGEELPREAIANPSMIGGSVLVETLLRAARARGVRLLDRHRVVHVHRDAQGAVVGVEARATGGRGTVLVGARRGVVFGSGGFLHDPQLVRDFLRGPVLGGCAAEGSTGDFVRIGIELGTQLGTMSQAWWTQCSLELAVRSRETAEDVWFPFGDSMVQVNKYGVRVMDEKQTYNDRGPVHFDWDAGRREFPNLVLFQIYDDVVAQNPAAGPFRGLVPPPGENASHVLVADTLEELAAAIDRRLAELSAHVAGLRLDPGFTATLRATLERFDGFAREGVDRDFGRGEKPIQLAWQGPAREGLANPCLAPFAPQGPYYCLMLAAGALDTKGGPRTDAGGRVLDLDGLPVPGLYGAGNCVSSPAGAGYWGGGGTIGPALVFGYLAGRNAAIEPDRVP